MTVPLNERPITSPNRAPSKVVWEPMNEEAAPAIEPTPCRCQRGGRSGSGDPRPCIVANTSSGTTASRIARTRPDVAILSVTLDENVARRLCLLWGAHSVRSEDIHTYEEMVEQAGAHARSEGSAQPPECIVVVAGVPFGTAGTANNLRVVQLRLDQR